MQIIFDYLTELSKNNHKEWFDNHKSSYEMAKKLADVFFKNIYTELAQHDNLAPILKGQNTLQNTLWVLHTAQTTP